MAKRPTAEAEQAFLERLQYAGGGDVLSRFDAAGWTRGELLRLFLDFDGPRRGVEAMAAEYRALAPLAERLRHRTKFHTREAEHTADLGLLQRAEGRPEDWLGRIFRLWWAGKCRQKTARPGRPGRPGRACDELGRIFFAALFGVSLSPAAYTEQRRRDETDEAS